MALPEQLPMSKRRLRGSRFYTLRNYYALGIIGGVCLISYPICMYSNYMKNCKAIVERFPPYDEDVERKGYFLKNRLYMSSKERAVLDFKIKSESEVQVDMNYFDDVMKDDKPHIDEL